MASDYRISSRYAKSLLQLAQERGLLDEVHADIQMFHEACMNSRELTLLLRNPTVKHERKRAILQALFSDKVNPLTAAFFDIISRKNREQYLESIAREFHNQFNDAKGIEMARVITASPLTEEIRKEFVSILKEISGKKEVEMTEEVDENLIGGYVLKVGDRQVDDSLSGKLRALKKQMIVNV